MARVPGGIISAMVWNGASLSLTATQTGATTTGGVDDGGREGPQVQLIESVREEMVSRGLKSCGLALDGRDLEKAKLW